jgi:hypothetical protein
MIQADRGRKRGEESKIEKRYLGGTTSESGASFVVA